LVGEIKKNEKSEWMPLLSENNNFMGPATRLFFMKATMKHLPVTGFHRFKNGAPYWGRGPYFGCLGRARVRFFFL